MPAHPTEDQIRNALIARVTAYCREAGIQPRTLCERAINSPGFFTKLKAGGNFTLKTYQRFLDYLDEQPASVSGKRSKAHRNGGG